MTVFTLGCDPEVFVRNRTTGEIVSAHGLIEGDKYSPTPVDSGAIQVDGLALEFNTNPVPVYSHEQNNYPFSTFNETVVAVMAQLKEAIEKKGDFGIEIISSTEFDQAYYDGLPPEVKKLGCEPDFDAYTGDKNIPPSADSSKRAAAGHIHIGWGKDFPLDHPDHLEICHNLVKQLDLLVGLPFVLFEDSDDAERRTMYGKAGAYRPKTYGVEYRTPSNKWLKTRQHRRLMWELVQAALHNMCVAKTPMYAFYEAGMPSLSVIVRDCINTNDKKKAVEILGQHYHSTYQQAIFFAMGGSFGSATLRKELGDAFETLSLRRYY